MPRLRVSVGAHRLAMLAGAALVGALLPGCARDVPAPKNSPINMARVKAHVKELSVKIGPRPAGSKASSETADWIARELAELGYAATSTSMRLPGGSQSVNVEARTPAEGKRLVLAAHFDTVEGCYCAGEAATGVALIIEIARLAEKRKDQIPLTFLFLGAEEELPGARPSRGFSAEQWLSRLPPQERGTIAGCIVLDKLGRGKKFEIYHMQDTPDSMASLCAKVGADLKPRPELKTVERWFPQMPFEDFGIPTAWVEWWPDPHAHKPKDTWDKVHWHKVELAGLLAWRLVLDKRWRQ